MEENQTQLQLPEDLIFEILLRVPAKYILKFRLVCKCWYALISATDSHFMDAFLGPYRRNNSLGLLYIDEKLNLCTINEGGVLNRIFSSEKTVVGCYFLSSIHGLVLLRHKQRVHVCNPTTGELISLPEYHHPLSGHGFSVDFAFGYDQSTRTYKVVQVICPRFHLGALNGLYVQRDESSRMRYAVFSLGSSSGSWSESWREIGSWREIEGPDDSVCAASDVGVYVNGVIYWNGVKFDRLSMVAFDVETEIFRPLTPPQPLVDYGLNYGLNYGETSLTELQGNLCLAHYSGYLDHEIDLVCVKGIDIWMLKQQPNDIDHGYLWDIMFKIVFEEKILHEITLLKFIGNNDDQKVVLFHEERLGLVSYDIGSKTLQTVNQSMNMCRPQFHKIIPYVNSLVMLQAVNPCLSE